MTMKSKYNRMVVMEGLRKRAEARQEAAQEAESKHLMQIINDNAYVANECAKIDEKCAKNLAADKTKRDRKAAYRAARKALEQERKRLLVSFFVTMLTGFLAILFGAEGFLTFGTALPFIVVSILLAVQCIVAMLDNAGDFAKLMEEEENEAK